jgi:uncharacterized heparinase superfamily protein
MERPVNLLQQLRKRVQSVTYGSSIYRLMLDQGPVPERLRLSLPDPWPGDAQAGQKLIASQPGLFDFDRSFPAVQKKRLLTHAWLRDLRAVGSDMARRKAVSLISDWIEEQENWDDDGWSPEVIGARLSNWIAFYDFYKTQLPTDWDPILLASMARQLRHLLHTAPLLLAGTDRLQAIKGLIYGGLALIEREKALGLGLELLHRQLEEELLPDGGTAARQPERHAQMLFLLIDIRQALKAAQLEVPLELALAISRMVPELKMLRHGDGGLALFNGGNEGSSLLLDAAITLSEARGRLMKRLPETGYERVTAGRSLLLMDVGAPPEKPFDDNAHAGLLSFEFSIGRERLIVNCGAGPEGEVEWRRAMGATAAHSTVTLGNTNACELLTHGGIGHGPREIDAQRYEQAGLQVLEASHDAYVGRYKMTLQRALALSENGEELRGREVLSGPTGKDFTVRWHLHPDVNAMLVQGGGAALLRLPSGAGWQLRLHGAFASDLALESSVYCGQGAPRRTMQLSVAGRTRENPTVVEWTLRREKIKKGKKT